MTISEYRDEVIVLLERLGYYGGELNQAIDSLTDDIIEEAINKGIAPTSFLVDWYKNN